MFLLLFAFITPCSSTTGQPFDDQLSRTVMFPLAAAAYSEHPEQCLTSQLKSAKVSKQVTLTCDYFVYDLCSGFTFVDETRKVIGVAFRGTSHPAQLLVELSSAVFEEKVAFRGGKISKYFNDAFLRVWNGGLGMDLLALLNRYPDYSIWITGHSLGGALASMAADHICSSSFLYGISTKHRMLLYTFGQPRTGDARYAEIHDSQVTSFRVNHRKDIVAHIPPQLMGYAHHGVEVWYNNDMLAGEKYEVCDAKNVEKCSDGDMFNTSIDDHKVYYGKNVSAWGNEGCP